MRIDLDDGGAGGGVLTQFDEKLYAVCPGALFRDETADSVKVIQAVKDLANYRSLREIIQEEAQKGYPGLASTYKMQIVMR